MQQPAMLALLLTLLRTLRSALRTRAELARENLALRRQLAALSRFAPRVRLRPADRAPSVGLSQIWSRRRAIQPPSIGRIVALPKVGGLHHRYERRAA